MRTEAELPYFTEVNVLSKNEGPNAPWNWHIFTYTWMAWTYGKCIGRYPRDPHDTWDPPSYVSFPSHSDQGGDSSPSQKRTRLHTVSLGGTGRFVGNNNKNREILFFYRGSLDLQYPIFLGNFEGKCSFQHLHLGTMNIVEPQKR